MQLKINTESEGDTLRLILAGEFDLGQVPKFRAALDAAEVDWRRLEVDLSDVVFMDSSGLGMLVRVNNRARESGQEVVLLRPSHPVASLLELTGLDSHFVVRE